MNDWIKSLQQARLKDAEEVPKGWKTVRQLQDIFHLNRHQTYVNCEAMVRVGLAEKRSFRVSVGSFIRSTPHYKVK